MSLRPDLAIIVRWIKPKSRVLDLGCGDGTLLRFLKEHRSITGYGLEIDPDNVAKAIKAGVNVIQVDLDKEGLKEYESNSFDYVIMTQALQAVHYPDHLLADMLRVGREGIVTFPNIGHWRCRLQLSLTGRMPISSFLPEQWYDTSNIHLCTVRDFEDLCRMRGYQILHRRVVDKYHRSNHLMQLAPNLMGEIALYSLRNRTSLLVKQEPPA